MITIEIQYSHGPQEPSGHDEHRLQVSDENVDYDNEMEEDEVEEEEEEEEEEEKEEEETREQIYGRVQEEESLYSKLLALTCIIHKIILCLFLCEVFITLFCLCLSRCGTELRCVK